MKKIINKMQCPFCKHEWILPKKEHDLGFKKCPKCKYCLEYIRLKELKEKNK